VDHGRVELFIPIGRDARRHIPQSQETQQMSTLPLAKLGKLLGADIASGAAGLSARLVLDALAETPEHVFDIVESLIAEGAKPDPDEDLLAADILMLTTVLENIRYGVEAGRREAIELADAVRRHLIEAQAKNRIEPRLMLLILNQFGAAKLDVGAELQGVMLRMMQERAEGQNDETRRQGFEGLRALASELGGDPFDIHATLNETAEALPENAQVTLAATLLAESDAGLAGAALGFLLSPSAKVRAGVARSLADGATGGAATGQAASISLRRILALRNWLPAPERPTLDEAIERLRQTGAKGAAWSKPAKAQAYISGFDGSGMQGMFIVVKEGRKHAIGGLIGRLGMGVRDAWVRHGASKQEAEALLHEGDRIGGMAPVGLDYVSIAVRHFLAGNAQSGLMPPFGLLAFAECAGLSGLDPEAIAVEDLVARLTSEIEPEQLTPAAVARILEKSARWPEEHALFDSWFEQGDDIAALLTAKRRSKAKKIEAVLAGPIDQRRHRWAELLAWTALSLKASTDAGTPWRNLATVAREVLSDRPLADIGLMPRIAERTVEANANSG
jgi:hypothetical protein